MYTKEHIKLLKAIIVDKETVFLARIGCEPRVSETGIANIIPQGIDRKSRDVAIYIATEIVRRWNAFEKGGSHNDG